jgi:hypothetical protein
MDWGENFQELRRAPQGDIVRNMCAATFLFVCNHIVFSHFCVSDSGFKPRSEQSQHMA